MLMRHVVINVPYFFLPIYIATKVNKPKTKLTPLPLT